MSSLFISDLHLTPEAPHISEAALQLVTHLAPQYQHLFILGDLVEYWLGDDAYDGSLDPVFNAISQLSNRGNDVRIMYGNRDFLFGEEFANRLGVTVIREDALVFEDEGLKLLLMHGDTLCTDDQPYQQMRLLLRNPQWQTDFLAKSVQERIQAAMQLREKSKAETVEKSQEIMDVNQQTVESVMQEYDTVELIHGHTHRPNTHYFTLNGQKARRTVLGDWTNEGAHIATLEKRRVEATSLEFTRLLISGSRAVLPCTLSARQKAHLPPFHSHDN